MGDKLKYTVSSGNVFGDLGDPTPEESLLKAQLAHRISTEIRDRGLTQEQAAETMGIDQPKVSALMRGRLTNFSVERLLKYVTALGNDVDIVVRPKVATEKRGTVQVHDSVAALGALQRAEPRLGSLRVGAMMAARSDASEPQRRWLRKDASRHLVTNPD